MCDWISIYYFMLIEFILKVNVDNVIVMWIVYGEMMNWKWMLMNFLELDWIVFVIENDVNMVYDELRLVFWAMCWIRNDLNYCDCGLEIMDMHWSDELCEIVCVWW